MKRLLVLSVFLLGILTACTQGAVEPNAITYALDPVNNSGIEGFVTFERESATETAVTISVEGTTDGVTYPAHLHLGDINVEDPQSEGDVSIALDPVVGRTGDSATLVSRKYADLVNLDAFVSVHSGLDDSVVAAGEIGEDANAVQIPVPDVD